MRVVLALPLALAACGDPPAIERGRLDEPAHAEHAGPAELTAAPAEHAQELADLRAIELDLVAGRLDEAKALAYLLARAPAPWMDAWPFGAAYAEAAALDVATARNLGEACRGHARVAVACAHCHLAAQHLPSEYAAPRPIDRAALHRWATARLLDGIVDADDVPWRSGLEALAESPAPRARLARGAWFAVDLETRARQALADPLADLDARGSAYGELLAICAGCHAALGR